MNRLYFGDNLEVLREHVADESVDLVYLDPPFNSQARYNVLFRTDAGDAARAQAEAFRDTWTWDAEAEWAFDRIARAGGQTATFVSALHAALGQSDLMAYLVMMAIRLHELRRVMKPTASLYLHCDPTASHYLKVILDGVFGPGGFLSEIAWKRTGTHSSARRWGPVHDVILFYRKGGRHLWNRPYAPHAERHLRGHYRKLDADGRRYEHGELTGAGVRRGRSGLPWRGFDVTAIGRHWTTTVDRLDELHAEGRIYIPADGGWPRLVRYADESKGRAIGDVWEDIPPINMRARERLGYPTQKPIALLERIVRASSNPGDVVLDPFCGCGTSVEAAQALGREWVGIDVAVHAIRVIEDRLARRFGDAAAHRLAGIPADLESARRLAERDKYQFQWWANYLVGVQQLREVKRGRDRGIDGELFFAAGPGRGFGRILTSVKGGKTVGVPELREFKAVLEREKADAGLFVCLRAPTRDMRAEAAGAGFYPHGRERLPRLQVVSIEEWFDGVRPVLPTLAHIARRAAEPARPAAGKTRGRAPDPRQHELLMPLPDGRRAGVHVNPSALADAPAIAAVGAP